MVCISATRLHFVTVSFLHLPPQPLGSLRSRSFVAFSVTDLKIAYHKYALEGWRRAPNKRVFLCAFIHCLAVRILQTLSSELNFGVKVLFTFDRCRNDSGLELYILGSCRELCSFQTDPPLYQVVNSVYQSGRYRYGYLVPSIGYQPYRLLLPSYAYNVRRNVVDQYVK